MSDPSILLLLTCVTCADSGDRLANSPTPDCSVESSSQTQRSRQLKSRIDCTQSVSTPETIPAFLTTASQPLATVQTTAREGAIAPRPSPPEPFILPETFTKPPTAADPPQSNRSSSASTSPVELPGLLKLGSRGEAVSRLQAKLQQLDYYTGAIDGIYGQRTFAAVTEFQRAQGLAVDGVAGPITWARLEARSATSATPLTQTDREATAILNPSNTAQPPSTTATESQTLDQTTQTARPSEAERVEGANTAGKIAENVPPEESQASRAQDTDLEQPSPQSQPTPDFIFDTSPSGGPFYFWIGAWALVYLGGMLFIFRSSINSKLGLKWGESDESDQQDIQLPGFAPSTLDQFVSGLDYSQSPDSSDGFGPAASNPAEQEKQNLVSQHDQSLYFSREENNSSPKESQAGAKPLNDLGKAPIFSLLEKLAYESPRLSNQELTPTWADGGVVEPVRGLFSDLPHPLGNYPSERRRNKAIATPTHAATSVQSINQSPNPAEPTTLIATLPAEDPETKNSYTYSLLDNAEGYFLLEGNELRIYDTALVKIESDVDHAITLRRTDDEGTQVDKSFVVSFTKTDDDAEMARSA